MCQYLVSLLSLCWIKDDHTIHPLIEGLPLPTGIEPTPFPTPFRNINSSRVAGLQVHAPTPGQCFRAMYNAFSPFEPMLVDAALTLLVYVL